MHFCTGQSDESTLFLKTAIDGAANGRAEAGRQLLGVSKPRADALLILEVRAASLGVIYSIPSLFHIKLAPSLLLLLYLFIPFPSNSSEASGSSLWSRNYHMSGTGK